MKYSMVVLLIFYAHFECISPSNNMRQERKLQPDSTEITNDMGMPDADKTDWNIYDIKTDTSGNYMDQLKHVNKVRLQLKDSYEKGGISIDSVGIQFCNLLVNRIIPYWYGTPWSFNGHTDIPNKGEIACGYFVSTTLKHIGMNLDRYKMAQQPALNVAKSIVPYRSILILRNISPEKMIRHIKQNFKEGIYLIGLDYHIGFILYRKGAVFFIHSGIFPPAHVTIEPAGESETLMSSNSFYLAAISDNTNLQRKWLQGSVIDIVSK